MLEMRLTACGMRQSLRLGVGYTILLPFEALLACLSCHLFPHKFHLEHQVDCCCQILVLSPVQTFGRFHLEHQVDCCCQILVQSPVQTFVQLMMC